MNRVLKVVFSRAKGMFVVVSELGRACTKGSLKSVLVAVPMALAATGAMAAEVTEARVQELINKALKGISIKLGSATEAPAQSTETGSIAIGDNSQATKSDSIALGAFSAAIEKYSIGAGGYAKSSGYSSIAIGGGSQTDYASAATGAGSIALGGGGYISKRTYYGAKASKDFSVAIGSASEASHVNSVALGVGSVTSADNTVSVGSGKSAHSSTYQYRRIVNVADGTQVHDAATYGQLSKLYNADGLTDANKTAWKTALGVSEASSISLINGTNTTVTASNGTYAVNVVANGSIAENDQGLVTGGKVYSAIDTAKTAVKDYADQHLDLKANVTASNIGKNISNEADQLANSKSWAQALGWGEIAENNALLVTGGKVYSAINSAKTEVNSYTDSKVQALTSNTDSKLADKATVALDNLTDAGKTVVRDLAQGAVKVEGTGYATVTSNKNQNNVLTYTVNVDANGSVASGNTGLVTGGVVYEEVRPTGTSYHYIANQKTSANLEALDAALFNALNSTTGVNKSAWWGALGGSISSDSADADANNGDGFVTGKDVYVEFAKSNDKISQNTQLINTNKATYDSYVTTTNGRLDTAESNITANSNAIAANKQEFDNYVTTTNGRLDTAESNITANSNAIVANKQEFDNYVTTTNGRLDTAESNITANSNAIVANKQEFDNYVTTTNGRLDAAESNITANSNAIAANKQEFDNYVTTTNDRFNSVETLAGKHTTVYGDSSDSNLTVENTAAAGEAKNYLVTLKKDLKLDSIKLGTTATVNADGLTVGSTSVKDGAITTDKVSANQVTVGSGDKQIVMNGNEGTFKVGTNLTLDSSGKIMGVAAGKVSADSTDAVNGSQLYETQQMIGQNASNIQTLNQQINKTYDKVQRVGAGAAALAALRPQDFSPEHPISGAVGLGHYDGKQAIAVGMYYRPTENFTVGFGASAAGNDDYMMNAGISYRFGGSGSQLRISQSDINRKVVDLTDQNRALVAQIESSNIREEASAKRLNRVQKELKAAQKKAEVADQKLDMVMKELAALREEIQKMKQR